MRKKKPVLFFDCGDTIVDESTQDIRGEVPGQGPVVHSADPIPGADTLLRILRDRGYRLGLVADGLVVSFENILKPLGLWDLFEVHVISEAVGVMKPHPRMFETAFELMGLDDQERRNSFMVGNNLSRDIRGANRMGMQSVFLKWSPRYPGEPGDDQEIPRFTIENPLNLLDLLGEERE